MTCARCKTELKIDDVIIHRRYRIKSVDRIIHPGPMHEACASEYAAEKTGLEPINEE